jgi:hypothetical protein
VSARDRVHGPRRGAAGLAALAIVVLSPAVAAANMGAPMLVLAWPTLGVLFVPIVVVEGLLARRLLGIPTVEALKLSLRVNAFSTIVGVPVTWIALVLLEGLVGSLLDAAGASSRGVPAMIAAPFFAAWPPATKAWHVYAAGAVLCVPFGAASAWLEARAVPDEIPRPDARRWARWANLATYGPAFVVLVAVAIASALRHA